MANRPRDDVPERVTLHLWGVRPSRVPAAVVRMGLDRRHLHHTAGLRFAKLLGTGHGRTFTIRDADLLHWGLVATWSSAAPAGTPYAQTGSTRRRAASRSAAGSGCGKRLQPLILKESPRVDVIRPVPPLVTSVPLLSSPYQSVRRPTVTREE